MMDGATERAEEIFCAAIEIESDTERMAYVEQSCAGDKALNKSVVQLLASYSGAERLFNEISPTPFSVVELSSYLEGQTGASSQDDGDVGKQIGNYTLLRKIGEGGCGNVYLAEQKKPVRRQVALKIIKAGMDTKSVIARFEAERQTLAMMEHPNIAHVLNAGATDEGRPYFVMELVHGIPVTAYCEENQLSIPQRLDLFMQICHAIHHAHQKGIIHRDIKPTNILVEQVDGLVVPKVIDFGIAKATGDQLQPGHTAFTASQPFLGTPAYMSPEQADLADNDIDVRSDIYSMGVLLYELLTGETPFDQKILIRSGLEEMRRTIREHEPLRPSVKLSELLEQDAATVAENRHVLKHDLKALLESDLDWVVMKALDKERDRRYQSANGLAGDIERYLAHEPVVARPPSRRYRFRKLVRRNKAVFAAVGIAAFGLLAGFGVSTWMFFREREARLEQVRLQQSAEYRALIAQAAVRIKYGDMEGADALLAEVPTDETSSSLEAAEAFQAIANWHMQEGRIIESGERYSSMARALSSADPSDVRQVSESIMPAAAVIVYAGEAQRYEEFRNMAIRRFGDTRNPAVARQIIKVCLLTPADQQMLQALAGPARVVEEGFESPNIDSRERQWACLSLALINYRSGNYTEAARWVYTYQALPEKTEVVTITMLSIRAMIARQAGLPEKARSWLAEGQMPVQKAFADNSWIKQKGAFSWFDWIIADLLIKEADGVRTEVTNPSQNDFALMFYLEEKERADTMLEGVSVDLSESPEHAIILRELCDWHARNDRFDKALTRCREFGYDRVSAGEENTFDPLRYAVLLVSLNDLDEYARFCKSLATRYAETDNPPVAQRVLRECLLAPASEELMDALRPYATVTERSFDHATTDQSMRGWQAYAMALWTYREEDYDETLAWCKLASPSGSGLSSLALSVRLIQVSALGQLDRNDIARTELAAAKSAMDEALSVDTEMYKGQWMGYWFDRTCVRIHLSEAEAVIGQHDHESD